MADQLQVARSQLERSIKECVELNLGHFRTGTKQFPKSITVQLGDLIHVNNVELPMVTVTVEI